MTIKRWAQNTAWWMTLGSAFFTTVYLNPTEMAMVPPEGSQVVQTPTRVDKLIERHHCWTDQAPVPVTLPGGVVVRLESGRVTYSRELVGPALDSAIGGELASFDVLAFCK